MGKEMYIVLNVDAKYYRNQFDDWLAGGSVYYRGRRYYWSAQDNNYGFGWEIEPVTDEEWEDISKDEFNRIISLVEKCLYEHETEYAS